MKLTVVMRAPQILLAIAVLLFLGFLASPTLIESVTSDGRVTMLPGYAGVLGLAVFLPSVVVHSGRREAIVFVSLFLAQVAFLVLPALVVLRRFRPWGLRVFFGVLFVAGLYSMAWVIGKSERVGFGVYLWLLGAVAATTFCLWPQDDT